MINRLCVTSPTAVLKQRWLRSLRVKPGNHTRHAHIGHILVDECIHCLRIQNVILTHVVLSPPLTPITPSQPISITPSPFIITHQLVSPHHHQSLYWLFFDKGTQCSLQSLTLPCSRHPVRISYRGLVWLKIQSTKINFINNNERWLRCRFA